MSTAKLSTEVWYIKLTPYHFHFFKSLAKEAGDTERGAEARQCRKFLTDRIIEYKRIHEKKVIS
jgi:CRISPR/Cas system endoribonuclease Cas6 (RAMP superfamily)